MDKKYCIDLIKDFLGSTNKTIADLESFSFYKLTYDINLNQKFGDFDFKNFQTCYPDCDNTELTKSILYLIYKDKFDEMGIELNYSEIGTGKRFRGETLNTFNTLFGTCSKNALGVFERLPLYGRNNEIFLKKMSKFYDLYLTIGNFMLLPNLTVEGQTINQYRGSTSGWMDYFHKFLIELKNYEKGALNEKSQRFYDLIKENDFYFNKINFDNFIKINFLDDYLENGEIKSFYGNELLRHSYFKNSKRGEDLTRHYIDYAFKYIDFASDIIKKRAQKIIEQIKTNI